MEAKKFQKPDPELNCPCKPSNPCDFHKPFNKQQSKFTPKEMTNNIINEYNSTNNE